MLAHFGKQNWWPAETPFEVMVGAVLTQNTNWGNVEKAIVCLKEAGVMELEQMALLPQEVLAAHIRPSGYYNQKAQRLQNLCQCIRDTGEGTVEGFLSLEPMVLRETLLSIKGIGPETADSIMLYAARQPVFVVDAYTFRILQRHLLLSDPVTYQELQELFMDNLPHDTALFNEYHALLVQVGKLFCRKRNPLCGGCPLQEHEGWVAHLDE
ncbi:MAG: endonuclease [Desulfobulbus propionicus]|nr:MAG: endonuclease [Desulfobulbus propionicus]